MNRTLSTLAAVFFISTLGSGCLLVERRGGGRSVGRPVASKPNCHPSQRWDGAQCRHKGKGHGARKHDGRR